jgi:hypothetical protein
MPESTAIKAGSYTTPGGTIVGDFLHPREIAQIFRFSSGIPTPPARKERALIVRFAPRLRSQNRANSMVEFAVREQLLKGAYARGFRSPGVDLSR